MVMMTSTEKSLPAFGRPWRSVDDHSGPTFVAGQGAWLVDSDGHRVLDATSGALNMLCGHGVGPAAEAYLSQLRTLAHVDMSYGMSLPAYRLAADLRAIPGRGGDRFFFCNSGSEGIELAVKIAALHWDTVGARRSGIVTFDIGYHGSTDLCQSLSGLPQTNHPPARSSANVYHLSFGEFSGAERRSPAARQHIMSQLREILGRTDAGAVLVEPFLNVGGAVRLPDGLLGDLRQTCDSHDALLILDEVFTGLGRSGVWFAQEHESVRPDITVFSKGLTNGICAMSGVAVDDAVLARLDGAVVPYGHTMAASPAACAAASATLEYMRDAGTVETVRELGAGLLDAVERELGGGDFVLDIRGVGLAIGIELETAGVAASAARLAYDLGVHLRRQGNTLLLAPPSCLDGEDVERLTDGVVAAVRKVSTTAGEW